jgi:Dickkopf N-terminal cysteine-rich region
MRVACLFVCVLGLLAVGCGGDGVDVSTSEDNVCSEIAEVACNNMYQCCTEGEIEDILEVSEPRTELQCREDIKRGCERSLLSLKDSLAAKRVRFNAERMNACLKAIVAPDDSCGAIVPTLPWREACMESAWEGTVAVGGTCIFAHDCDGAPDNFCAPNQKCTAKPTGGFPCGSGCASAFYCSAGTCQSRLAAGAPCLTSSQCQQELFCDSAALPQAVCAARMPGGSSCTSSAGCASGQCVPGQCMGSTQGCFRDTDCSARCANTGAICTSSSQCSTGTCSVGGNACLSQTSCTAGGGDTCVFPVLCVPGDCIGDPICTAQTVSVDYCNAVDELPRF